MTAIISVLELRIDKTLIKHESDPQWIYTRNKWFRSNLDQRSYKLWSFYRVYRVTVSLFSVQIEQILRLSVAPTWFEVECDSVPSTAHHHDSESESIHLRYKIQNFLRNKYRFLFECLEMLGSQVWVKHSFNFSSVEKIINAAELGKKKWHSSSSLNYVSCFFFSRVVLFWLFFFVMLIIKPNL